jgi:hypothetical protein
MKPVKSSIIFVYYCNEIDPFFFFISCLEEKEKSTTTNQKEKQTTITRKNKSTVE